MLALLWARADAARLERLGHQMLKYETYLVPTLAGMDAILGRYTARIRQDGDAAPTGRRSARSAGGGSASASSARRGRRATSPTGRGAARATPRSSATTPASGAGPGRNDALKPCGGLLFHEELHRLRACGLSSAAVRRAATAAAADTLGHPDLGRVAPGAQADLVLVAGNPLRRLADARAVRAVVVRGRLLERDSLLPGPRTRTHEEAPMKLLRVFAILGVLAAAALPASPARPRTS